MRYIITILFLILFLGANNGFTQWQYWEANEFPTATADTAWHLGPDDHVEVTFSTIIDDPDITGNKLLQFSTAPNGSDRETFRYNWKAVPATGATLVLRMKPIGDGNHDRDWDIYLQNGEYRERLIANNGNRIKFDKSGIELTPIDISGWHIYRFTIEIDAIDLYIDEDPLAWLSTNGQESTGNFFLFGDNGGDTYGTIYDWIAWDVSGPYPPEQGDPLPSNLTGLPASVERIGSVIPEEFELFQNFPNPFNPSTEIRFNLVEKSDVTLNIYDVRGRLIRTLVSDSKQAGEYKVRWDGRDMGGNAMPSGIYFCTIQAGSSSISKKMTLLK